jgi:hypothetical protein
MLRNLFSSKRSVILISLGLLVLAALAAMTPPLVPGAAKVDKGDERRGYLHATKECPAPDYTGAAGGFCTIASSDLAKIPFSTTVFYDQAAGPPLGSGVPTGFLDSNVLLWVGTLDWAVGRCTVDFSAYPTPYTTPVPVGLCTFTDGTGPLTGFQARLVVSYTGGTSYTWDGPYSFSPGP